MGVSGARRVCVRVSVLVLMFLCVLRAADRLELTEVGGLWRTPRVAPSPQRMQEHTHARAHTCANTHTTHTHTLPYTSTNTHTNPHTQTHKHTPHPHPPQWIEAYAAARQEQLLAEGAPEGTPAGVSVPPKKLLSTTHLVGRECVGEGGRGVGSRGWGRAGWAGATEVGRGAAPRSCCRPRTWWAVGGTGAKGGGGGYKGPG